MVFRSLVGKFAPKQRQPHARVFGFCPRFSVLIEIYFGFAVASILCSVLPFLIHPNAPKNEARVLPRPRERYTIPCYLCESQAVKHNEFSANKVRINYIKRKLITSNTLITALILPRRPKFESSLVPHDVQTTYTLEESSAGGEGEGGGGL